MVPNVKLLPMSTFVEKTKTLDSLAVKDLCFSNQITFQKNTIIRK